MFEYPWGDFALNLAGTAVGVVVSIGIIMGIALMIKNHSIIDIFWGPAFVVVAVISYVMSVGSEGHDGRRLLVLALVSIWGLRLGAHIGWRNIGKGEDPRYTALLRRRQGSLIPFLVRKIYALQALLAWVVSIPIQFAMYQSRGLDVIVAVGVVVWVTGFAFETIGDWQLARFKADAGNAGKIMDRGLWAWTRHPNYFGDACVWFAFFLFALGTPWGVLTIYSPVLMTWLLLNFGGKSILERWMSRSRGEAFDAYVARTSGFFPRPPKKVS